MWSINNITISEDDLYEITDLFINVIKNMSLKMENIC